MDAAATHHAGRINTGCGPSVTEIDLMVALRAGRLAAAAIGVYDAQRPIIDYPFRSPDNETIMPHP